MADDPVVQTTYSDTLPIGLEGQPATMHNHDADTKFVETAAGIAFGRAVSRGSSEKGVVIGGATFLGVTYRDITLITPIGGTVDITPQKAEVGVMVRGDVWVKPSTAVTQASPVIFNATTGVFGGAAGTQIAGASYIRGNGGVAGGLALLRLGGSFTTTTV